MSNIKQRYENLDGAEIRATRYAHLNGFGFVEAFRETVWADPVVIAAIKTWKLDGERHRALVAEGRCPNWSINYHWPLDTNEDEFAFGFVRSPVFFVPGPPLPTPSEGERELASLIVGKIRSLRRALTAGDLVAHGMYEKTGSFGPIHHLQWARRGLAVDAQSGDLVQEVNGKFVVLWSGLALEAKQPPSSSTSVFHVNTLAHDDVRQGAMSVQPSVSQRRSAAQASTAEAVASLWPEGVPESLLVKVRDQMIMQWQRHNQRAVASAKSIQRYFGAKLQQRH